MDFKTTGIGFDTCAFLDYDASNDLYLYEIGKYVCPSLYSYGPVIRTRDIIHYVYRGRGRLILKGKEYKIGPNHCFLIPAGYEAYYEADEDNPWEYSWLHLGGPRLQEFYQLMGLSPEHPVYSFAQNSRQYELLYDELTQNSDSELYCIGKLYELFDCMIKNSAHQNYSTVSQHMTYIKKIIKYIQLKYPEQIQVQDIALSFGLDRSYLSRLFKEATGSSIQNYIIKCRMKAAMKLLSEGNNTIQYISFAVGYSDIFTFSKAFKKYTGMSPSEWASKHAKV